jgi:imidazole glycerol-phosphate synthase subunit HisH
MTAVVDYDIGNVKSVCKAIEYLGGKVLLTRKQDELKRADRIILPGVGAFQPAIDRILHYGLDKILHEEVLYNKKPFLGICLGMQLITNHSHENGFWHGLGWVDAEVHKLSESSEYKLPQFGWNTTDKIFDHDLMNNIPPKTAFYFANSYHVKVNEIGIVILTATYGEKFVSAFVKKNIFCTQFHPEKSQEFGLQLLENFLNWEPEC